MRWLGISALVVFAMHAAGCSMCCSPHDNEYATYGGRIPRVDQVNGRVGSPFSDPSLMGTATNVETASGHEEVYVPPVRGVNSAPISDEPMTIEQDDFDTPLEFD